MKQLQKMSLFSVMQDHLQILPCQKITHFIQSILFGIVDKWGSFTFHISLTHHLLKSKKSMLCYQICVT